MKIRLASWNVNSLKVRLPQVLDWLERSGTDALAIEETKMTDDAFPAEAFAERGFWCRFAGQRTYNGVAVIGRRSRFAEPAAFISGIPGYPDDQKRFLALDLLPADASDAWSGAPIRFCCGYFPNGMAVGSSKYLYKLDWLAALSRTLRAMLAENPRLVLGGDYNIAPEDRDLWNPAAWAGQTPCSAPERETFRRLLSLGLSDSFRLFGEPAESYSWWDYRQSGFEKNHGMRIDMLLVSEALKPWVANAAIDAGPRANPQPSDHAPVLVDLKVPPEA